MLQEKWDKLNKTVHLHGLLTIKYAIYVNGMVYGRSIKNGVETFCLFKYNR